LTNHHNTDQHCKYQQPIAGKFTYQGAMENSAAQGL
jgi:hypothetical protein